MPADHNVESAKMQDTAVEIPTVALGENGTTQPIFQSVPRWAVIGIFLLLLVGGIATARAFLMPVVLGFLLALVFSPVRRFLERCGVSPGVSACGIVGALVVVLMVGVIVLADPVSRWVDDAPAIGRQIERKLKSLMSSTKAVVEANKQINKMTAADQDADVQEVVVREPGLLANLAMLAPEMLAQSAFVLVLLLFLLASGDMFYEKIVHVMPTFRDKRQAIRIAYDIERKLSRYLFTISLINAGLGIAIGIAMWWLGMPNPLLFGVIGFALNYVPYLGAVIGMAIVTLVSLITFDDTSYALLPGLIYFALTAVEGQFVTPYFVGRRLEMNTVVIFLAVAFWAWMWSVMGMLVAVPLLVAIRAFCEHLPQLESVGNFLSTRGSEIVDKESD